MSCLADSSLCNMCRTLILKQLRKHQQSQKAFSTCFCWLTAVCKTAVMTARSLLQYLFTASRAATAAAVTCHRQMTECISKLTMMTSSAVATAAGHPSLMKAWSFRACQRLHLVRLPHLRGLQQEVRTVLVKYRTIHYQQSAGLH